MDTVDVRIVTGFTVAGDSLTISTSTSAITRVQKSPLENRITFADRAMRICILTQQRSHVSMSARPRLLLPVVTGIVRRAWQ